MMSLIRSVVVATFVSWVLLVPTQASACGGCFSPPTGEQSSVTGHRMAFATSQDRTVLWDQFEYTGRPEDFSWVLPVRREAYLEESTDAWFESLETVTQTRIVGPQLDCGGGDFGGDGCGCAFGGMSAATAEGGDDGGGGGRGGVQIVHRGTVGPYDTVTLRSTSGDALSTWLLDNGYFIPPDIEPIIAAYVAEGADFIALRLQPGVGVQQMTPVRVVTPGGDAILPLRMVSAGIGENVKIVLYVLGELRFGMPDLTAVSIDEDDLVWDFTALSSTGSNSNYAELRRQALARDIGFNYMTTFADVGAFFKQYSTADGFPIGYAAGGYFLNNFADLYFTQARVNDNQSGIAPCASVVNSLRSQLLVRDAAGTGELDASAFVCDDYTDIAAAMIGMHPARVWTTRLELDLPREALVMDCVVTASESQKAVSNQLKAIRAKNLPAGCTNPESPVLQGRVAAAPPEPRRAWLLALALMGALHLRRSGTRRRFFGAGRS